MNHASWDELEALIDAALDNASRFLDPCEVDDLLAAKQLETQP